MLTAGPNCLDQAVRAERLQGGCTMSQQHPCSRQGGNKRNASASSMRLEALSHHARTRQTFSAHSLCTWAWAGCAQSTCTPRVHGMPAASLQYAACQSCRAPVASLCKPGCLAQMRHGAIHPWHLHGMLFQQHHCEGAVFLQVEAPDEHKGSSAIMHARSSHPLCMACASCLGQAVRRV